MYSIIFTVNHFLLPLMESSEIKMIIPPKNKIKSGYLSFISFCIAYNLQQVYHNITSAYIIDSYIRFLNYL